MSVFYYPEVKPPMRWGSLAIVPSYFVRGEKVYTFWLARVFEAFYRRIISKIVRHSLRV